MNHKLFESEQMSLPKRAHPRNVTSCGTCGCVLGAGRYIRCRRCPNFIQCLQCFSVGMEQGKHSNAHPYIVVEATEGAIYRDGWDSGDEIMLLYGIQIYGVGNWNEIANFMKTKTALQIETHYLETYIRSPVAPLPVDAVLPEEQEPPPLQFDTKPVESCPSEAHEKRMMEKNKREKTTPAEFCGFMPHRHEFEINFNNNAEAIVAPIAFSVEDTTENFRSKVKSLLLYNSQLQERKFRTKIIEDMDLMHNEVKAGSKNDSSMSFLAGSGDHEKFVNSKLLTLAPYLGLKEVGKLASGINQSIHIKELIGTRTYWQDHGIKTYSEGQLFSGLLKLVKDGKIPARELDNWNNKVHRYVREQGADDADCMSETERELCKRRGLSHELYMALKSLIIREHTFCEGMSRSEAMRLSPEHRDHIGAMYDLLVANGTLG